MGKWESGKVGKWESGLWCFTPSHFHTVSLSGQVLSACSTSSRWNCSLILSRYLPDLTGPFFLYLLSVLLCQNIFQPICQVFGRRRNGAHPGTVASNGRIGSALSSSSTQGRVGLGWRIYEYPVSVILLDRSIVGYRWIISHGYTMHNAGFETELTWISQAYGLGDQGIRYQLSIGDDRVEALPGTERFREHEIIVAEFTEACSGGRMAVREGSEGISKRGESLGPFARRALPDLLVRESIYTRM